MPLSLSSVLVWVRSHVDSTKKKELGKDCTVSRNDVEMGVRVGHHSLSTTV